MISKNTIIIILVIAVAALTYFLLQKPDKEYVTVKVPVSIKATVPSQTITFEPVELPTPKKVSPRPKQVEEIKNLPEKDKDSVLELLTAVRTYVEKYTDEKGEAVITSRVQGYLLSQEAEVEVYPYTITVEDTIPVTIEVPKNIKFFIGGGVGSPILNDFDPFIFGTVGIQNRKDRILTLTYGSNNTAMLGYLFKL